jgi:leader peptidase (prepilin peptidase)/N-methyltransferase
MQIYYIIIFFIFGIVFGSFFNVVGYRVPKDMSIAYPSSHCPNCKHKLNALDLIPIFSYIFSGGKCRYCKKKIPIFYLVIELLTGLLFVLTYLVFGLSINTIIILLFVSMSIILILSDILYMIIPDSILIVFGVLILIIKIIMGTNISFMILDILIPFMFMYLLKLFGDKLFKKESLGGGDIKLMLVIGLVIGWELSIFSVVLSSFIALPISIYNLIKKKDHILPYGPYLLLSALICIFLKLDINYIINLLIQ